MSTRIDVLRHCFDHDPDHSSKCSTDGHGRNKDARRNFAAVRNHHKADANQRCEEERIDHRPFISRSYGVYQLCVENEIKTRVLAEVIEVARAITFFEKNSHTFRHVDAHEMVEPSNHGGYGGERNGFSDSVSA